MIKSMLILVAAASACLIAHRALRTRRVQNETGELKREIKRWEDEGGNSALHASGMDDAFGP